MYEGGWKSDMQEGQGKLTEADGGVYDGGWMTGEMEGQGKFTYASGSVYKGGWKEHKLKCFSAGTVSAAMCGSVAPKRRGRPTRLPASVELGLVFCVR